MIVVNSSRVTILSQNAKFAKSLIGLTFGLHLKNNSRTLIFKTRFGIHTLGLKEPIDVLVLDSDLKVVKIKESLQPNWFFFWNPKFNLVIELPAEIIRISKTQPGDQLLLKREP